MASVINLFIFIYLFITTNSDYSGCQTKLKLNAAQVCVCDRGIKRERRGVVLRTETHTNTHLSGPSFHRPLPLLVSDGGGSALPPI